MQQPLALLATLDTATAALGACAPQAEVSEDRGQPVHAGIQTILPDDDMVGVALRGAADRADVEACGRCAAAQHALDRGYGFARHVRTIARKDGQSWRGDAVYLIPAGRPEGLHSIDAEAAVTECAGPGIPTV